jgi:PAS domain S-box-containing protein
MSPKLISRNSWLVRYSAALAAVGMSLIGHRLLAHWVGPGLSPYITFYPGVIIVALLAGLGPGLLATVAASLVVAYYLLPPSGFGIERAVDAISLALFLGINLLMCAVAELLRRARVKAAAFDREQALRQSDERLQFALEASHTGAWDLDLVRHNAFRSLEHDRIFGYDTLLPEWSYERFLEHVIPEDRAAVDAKFRQATATQSDWAFECRIRRVDGEVRWVWATGRHTGQGVDGSRRMAGIVQDITERKRTEEAVHRLNAELQQRVAELQAANEALGASRRAALNLMEDALQARQQAEAANAELYRFSEQRRLALEAANLGTWDYHFQTGLVFWDKRCCQMWGLTESEHLGYAAAISRIHPEDRAGVDSAVLSALAGRNGGDYHREFRVVWADGTVHWIASHGRVYFEGPEAERHATRFIGANLDITAERQAQQALGESRQRLEAFAAATFEGIVLSDQGRILDCNEQFAQMAGRTVEELRGTPIERLIAPEDRDRVMENIRTGRESVIEHRMVRGDGSRLTIEAHGRPSNPPDSRLRHTAVRDITERKQAELRSELLAETASQLLATDSPDRVVEELCKKMLVFLDCQVFFNYLVDERAGRLRLNSCAGIPAQEVQRIEWLDYGGAICGCVARDGCRIVAEDIQQTDDPPADLVRSYGIQAYVCHPLLSQGRVLGTLSFGNRTRRRFTAEELSLIKAVADQVAIAMERQRVQAALRETAEELKRSNRDLEQFAYVASHDLQEPLRAVGGYVKLLERRFPETLDAKAREFVGGAVDGALRMERLISDLLTFSRVGTHGGSFVPTDLNAVLQQTLANLCASIQSADAVITHDGLPTLKVDGTQMMQLFQNLLSNALKFRSPSPPRIHVAVQKQDRRWVFSVRDNGIGIDPRYFERIFHVFQRLHTRRQYPGTGIGLAICKKIVERHGGELWVESEPGEGATFYFSIPENSHGGWKLAPEGSAA